MPSPLDAADAVDRTVTAATNALKGAIKSAMGDARKVAREELMATARIVPGADRRFSRWYPGRGTLSVRARSIPGGVRIVPKGPWKVAEEGTRPRGGHPGTRAKQGRRSWSTGQEATLRHLERTMPDQITGPVEEVWRG